MHQLNINKCITKQYHEMTIEYLSLLVSWVDSFLSLQLHHLLHSSFLIQILRWIRGSLRVKSFVFPHCLRDIIWMVRAWSSVAPIFSFLIMSWASSSSQSLLKVITSFWHTFLSWMNPMILVGYHHFCILHFFFYCFKLFFDLRDPCKVWLHGLCILDLHILQLVSQSNILILNSLVKESNIFSVFMEDTCGAMWSVIESMIFLALTKFFWCKAFSLISL